MINKISRFLIIVLLSSVIIIYGKPLFKKFFFKQEHTPQIHYSLMLDKFLIADYNQGSKKRYYDQDKNFYSKHDYQTFLPMIYYRDLLIWKNFPGQIRGSAISPVEIEKNRQLLIVKGKEFNSPEIKLYPLYESKSLYSQIEAPDKMFRIDFSIEFIDAKTNKIDKEKSLLFTKALTEKGFKFPAKEVFGNRSRKKPFDEGYFIKDSSQKLFHLKMQNGLPFVKDTNIKPDSGIKFIKTEENLRKEFYGVLFTHSNEIFLISYDNYRLIRLPVENFNHKNMSFYLSCDLLKRTIRINNGEYIYTTVTDRDYNLIGFLKVALEKYDKTAEKYSKIIFPVSIETHKKNSAYIYLDPQYNIEGFFSAFLSVLFLGLFFKFKKIEFKKNYTDFVIVLLGGVPVLASVLIVSDFCVNNQ